MTAWKELERLVAAVLGGIRSWDTDHDALIVTDTRPLGYGPRTMPENLSGGALLALAQAGVIELASVEVKNLKGPTVAELEGYLRKNRAKADRDGVRFNALVVKRKAGRGIPTMPLLVVPLEEFRGQV